MCEWCDENGGEPIGCQNGCGRVICFDHKGSGDDYMTQPYVTTQGDVFCWFCGQREQQIIDDLEEEEADEWGWMDVDPYDGPFDFDAEN